MYKLIVLSVLAVLACALGAPADTGEADAYKIFQNAVQKCITEQKVSEDDAKIVSNHAQLPHNDAQSCLIECIAINIGQIKDNKLDRAGFDAYSKIRYANNQAKLDESAKVYEKCKPEVEKKASEKCGAGVAMRTCIIEFFNLKN